MKIIYDDIKGKNVEIKLVKSFLFGLITTEYHVISNLSKLEDKKFDIITFYDVITTKKVSEQISAEITTWILLNDDYKEFLMTIINNFNFDETDFLESKK